MRIKFFNRLALFGVAAALLFTSCKKDDGGSPETINVSNSTWVYNSDADITAGVTLKLYNNTYEYTTTNYDGAKEFSRGTFANVPPYEIVLTQEDGTQFARGLKKEDQGALELEIYMQGGATPQFQDHVYIQVPSTSPNYKNITLTKGGEGNYIAMPSTLDISVSNDSLDGHSAATDFIDVRLDWDLVEGATHYRVYREGATVYENDFFDEFRNLVGIPTTGGGYAAGNEYTIVSGDSSFVILPLQSASVSYNYFVAAYSNSMPMGSPAFAYKLNESKSIAPTGLNYLVVGGDIQLMWDRHTAGAVSMNNAAYKIYQVRPDGKRIEIAMVAADVSTDFDNKQSYTVAQDQITNAEFVSGEEYDFDVTAITAIGVESNATGIQPVFYDKVANVTEYRDEDGKKMLTWDKVGGAANYRIYSFPTSTVDMDTTLIGGGIADNKVGVDAYGTGASPKMAKNTSYNFSVSASANGEYSDTREVAYFEKTSGAGITPNAAVDTVTIDWKEVGDLSFDADSYTISYAVAVDGEYDYNNATGEVTVSMSDVDSNDRLDYTAGSPGTFEYEYRIPASLSGESIRFYVVVNGNGTTSDAVTAGTQAIP